MTILATRIVSAALALAALFAVVVADPAAAQDRYDRRVVVINETGRVIYTFHSTNKSVRTWGPDLLGSDVIQPGQRWIINFDDRTGYCVFDFKAVLDNGRAIERYGVDVCTVASWTVR